MTMNWPQTDVQSVGPAADALAGVWATVAIAASLAESGRAVDLAGLDAATGTMCAQVLDLPPDQGATLRASLASLDGRLAALARMLADRAR